MQKFEQNGAQICGNTPPIPKTVAVASGWWVAKTQAMPVLSAHVAGRVRGLRDAQGNQPQLQRSDIVGTKGQICTSHPS